MGAVDAIISKGKKCIKTVRVKSGESVKEKLRDAVDVELEDVDIRVALDAPFTLWGPRVRFEARQLRAYCSRKKIESQEQEDSDKEDSDKEDSLSQRNPEQGTVDTTQEIISQLVNDLVSQRMRDPAQHVLDDPEVQVEVEEDSSMLLTPFLLLVHDGILEELRQKKDCLGVPKELLSDLCRLSYLSLLGVRPADMREIPEDVLTQKLEQLMCMEEWNVPDVPPELMKQLLSQHSLEPSLKQNRLLTNFPRELLNLKLPNKKKELELHLWLACQLHFWRMDEAHQTDELVELRQNASAQLNRPIPDDEFERGVECVAHTKTQMMSKDVYEQESDGKDDEGILGDQQDGKDDVGILGDEQDGKDDEEILADEQDGKDDEEILRDEQTVSFQSKIRELCQWVRGLQETELHNLDRVKFEELRMKASQALDIQWAQDTFQKVLIMMGAMPRFNKSNEQWVKVVSKREKRKRRKRKQQEEREENDLQKPVLWEYEHGLMFFIRFCQTLRDESCSVDSVVLSERNHLDNPKHIRDPKLRKPTKPNSSERRRVISKLKKHPLARQKRKGGVSQQVLLRAMRGSKVFSGAQHADLIKQSVKDSATVHLVHNADAWFYDLENGENEGDEGDGSDGSDGSDEGDRRDGGDRGDGGDGENGADDAEHGNAHRKTAAVQIVITGTAGNGGDSDARLQLAVAKRGVRLLCITLNSVDQHTGEMVLDISDACQFRQTVVAQFFPKVTKQAEDISMFSRPHSEATTVLDHILWLVGMTLTSLYGAQDYAPPVDVQREGVATKRMFTKTICACLDLWLSTAISHAAEELPKMQDFFKDFGKYTVDQALLAPLGTKKNREHFGEFQRNLCESLAIGGLATIRLTKQGSKAKQAWLDFLWLENTGNEENSIEESMASTFPEGAGEGEALKPLDEWIDDFLRDVGSDIGDEDDKPKQEQKRSKKDETLGPHVGTPFLHPESDMKSLKEKHEKELAQAKQRKQPKKLVAKEKEEGEEGEGEGEEEEGEGEEGEGEEEEGGEEDEEEEGEEDEDGVFTKDGKRRKDTNDIGTNKNDTRNVKTKKRKTNEKKKQELEVLKANLEKQLLELKNVEEQDLRKLTMVQLKEIIKAAKDKARNIFGRKRPKKGHLDLKMKGTKDNVVKECQRIPQYLKDVAVEKTINSATTRKGGPRMVPLTQKKATKPKRSVYADIGKTSGFATYKLGSVDQNFGPAEGNMRKLFEMVSDSQPLFVRFFMACVGKLGDDGFPVHSKLFWQCLARDCAAVLMDGKKNSILVEGDTILFRLNKNKLRIPGGEQRLQRLRQLLMNARDSLPPEEHHQLLQSLKDSSSNNAFFERWGKKLASVVWTSMKTKMKRLLLNLVRLKVSQAFSDRILRWDPSDETLDLEKLEQDWREATNLNHSEKWLFEEHRLCEEEFSDEDQKALRASLYMLWKVLSQLRTDEDPDDDDDDVDDDNPQVDAGSVEAMDFGDDGDEEELADDDDNDDPEVDPEVDPGDVEAMDFGDDGDEEELADAVAKRDEAKRKWLLLLPNGDGDEEDDDIRDASFSFGSIMRLYEALEGMYKANFPGWKGYERYPEPRQRWRLQLSSSELQHQSRFGLFRATLRLAMAKACTLEEAAGLILEEQKSAILELKKKKENKKKKEKKKAKKKREKNNEEEQQHMEEQDEEEHEQEEEPTIEEILKLTKTKVKTKLHVSTTTWKNSPEDATIEHQLQEQLSVKFDNLSWVVWLMKWDHEANLPHHMISRRRRIFDQFIDQRLHQTKISIVTDGKVVHMMGKKLKEVESWGKRKKYLQQMKDSHRALRGIAKALDAEQEYLDEIGRRRKDRQRIASDDEKKNFRVLDVWALWNFVKQKAKEKGISKEDQVDRVFGSANPDNVAWAKRRDPCTLKYHQLKKAWHGGGQNFCRPSLVTGGLPSAILADLRGEHMNKVVTLYIDTGKVLMLGGMWRVVDQNGKVWCYPFKVTGPYFWQRSGANRIREQNERHGSREHTWRDRTNLGKAKQRHLYEENKRQFYHEVLASMRVFADKMGDGRDFLVIVEGGFDSGGFGHRRPPIKEFLEFLAQFVLVGESGSYLNSQLCSKCGGKLLYAFDKRKESPEIRTKMCESEHCRKDGKPFFVNRDFNAAMNLMLIDESEAWTGLKPERFRNREYNERVLGLKENKGDGGKADDWSSLSQHLQQYLGLEETMETINAEDVKEKIVEPFWTDRLKENKCGLEWSLKTIDIKFTPPPQYRSCGNIGDSKNKLTLMTCQVTRVRQFVQLCSQDLKQFRQPAKCHLCDQHHDMCALEFGKGVSVVSGLCGQNGLVVLTNGYALKHDTLRQRLKSGDDVRHLVSLLCSFDNGNIPLEMSISVRTLAAMLMVETIRWNASLPLAMMCATSFPSDLIVPALFELHPMFNKDSVRRSEDPACFEDRYRSEWRKAVRPNGTYDSSGWFSGRLLSLLKVFLSSGHSFGAPATAMIPLGVEEENVVGINEDSGEEDNDHDNDKQDNDHDSALQPVQKKVKPSKDDQRGFQTTPSF